MTQIKAKIIAHSINYLNDVEAITWELEYPRFIHCFDKETEILCKVENETPTFLSFEEAFKRNALVAEYNDKTNGVKFVIPNTKIKYFYNGEMISFENQRLNFLVTPEHRLFVGSRKNKTDKKEIILAKDLLSNYTQKRFYKSGNNSESVIMNPELLKLVAYFISDGTLPKFGNQAIFRFVKERKIVEVCRLLDVLGISYEQRLYKDGVTNIVLNRLQWMNSCYDEEGNKVLPSEFFNMDTKSFESFKEGLLESDGYIRSREYNNYSEKLIDQLQALFTVNNCSFNKKQYGDCFKVKFLKEDEPVLRKDKHKVDVINYNDFVYCVSVNTGLIIVRRKGIVHISGNCEFMTHRQFSRNAASSRAIPVMTVIEQVENNPACPIYWGKNQAGMQAKEELTGSELDFCKREWELSAVDAAYRAKRMHEQGLHKQNVNRILEPYQFIKVVMTSTERINWTKLRYHSDAQPEIYDLAMKMKHAQDNSIPRVLYHDEWHIPYIHWNRDNETDKQYFYTVGAEGKKEYLLEEEALIISSSLCAQVSYRKSDDTLEKATKIYDRLVNTKPVHASPLEHQLLVAHHGFDKHKGWTHVDKWGNYWSGNIRGFVQHRQLIPNHDVKEWE